MAAAHPEPALHRDSTLPMKTICILAALAAAPVLSGAVAVGRGELTFGVAAVGTYDSNPGGQFNADDDFYGTVTPELGYTRRAGRIEAEASAALAIVRFVEQSRYDAENARVSGTLRLADATSPKTSASLQGSYTETTDVNPDVNARLESASTRLNAESAWLAGARMNFGLTGSYLDAVSQGASNTETVTAGGTWGYRDILYDNSLFTAYTFQDVSTSGENIRRVALNQTAHEASVGLGRPLVRDVYGRVGVGYRILERSRDETFAGQGRQEGMTFSAGVEGPFLPRRYFPKVTSRANLTYGKAATPGIDDLGTKQLGADVSIVWDAGPRTVVSFSANRSQRLSVLDYTVLSTGVRASVSQRLRHNLTGSVTAAHNWESFRGLAREDTRTNGQAELAYEIRTHWRAALSYQIESVDSSVPTSSYDRHLVAVTIGWTL